MEPIKIELPSLVDKTLSPLGESIGNTLSSIWDLCFGWIDISAEKVQYKRIQNLHEFKESIEKGISQIPEGNLQEPNLTTIGPTLEASKYYFEEKELRDMFSKLIINSMNSAFNNVLHPAYAEIIKQLSPTDAVVFRALSEQQEFAICQLNVASKKDSDVLLSFSDEPYIDEILISDLPLPAMTVLRHILNIPGLGLSQEKLELSIDNLQRLSLISIAYNQTSVGKDYDEFKTHPFITNHLEQPLPNGFRFILVPGICSTTALGNNFAKACL